MKILISILLCMLGSYNIADDPPHKKPTVDGDVYVYEYSMKKPNQAGIGFIIINNDLIVQDIYFIINISQGKIKNIYRRDNTITNGMQYSRIEYGNILIEKNKLICYDSENFIIREKRIPDYIYKIISLSFLEKTNKERLKILNQLSIQVDSQ